MSVYVLNQCMSCQLYELLYFFGMSINLANFEPVYEFELYKTNF